MGLNHSRLAVWTLAILTAVAIAGDRTAFASDNNPRVNGGGQFFQHDPSNVQNGGSDKVNIGITGKYDKNGMPQGHLEYHNEFSGLKANGKITSLAFETLPTFDNITGMCSSTNDEQCACVAFAQSQGADLSGRPAAVVDGNCDKGTCTFHVRVVDATDGGPKGPGKAPDWVCNVNVSGTARMNMPANDTNPAAPLIHGHIEIKNQ